MHDDVNDDDLDALLAEVDRIALGPIDLGARSAEGGNGADHQSSKPGCDGDPPRYVVYRVEPRGPDEYVALVQGDVVWRGKLGNPDLDVAVTWAAAQRFLKSLD